MLFKYQICAKLLHLYYMDDVYLILVLVKLEILFNFISICLHFRSHPVDSIHLKIEWIDHEPKWKPKGMLHIIWEFIMLKLPSMNVMFSQVYTRFHLFENRKKNEKKKIRSIYVRKLKHPSQQLMSSGRTKKNSNNITYYIIGITTGVTDACNHNISWQWIAKQPANAIAICFVYVLFSISRIIK